MWKIRTILMLAAVSGSASAGSISAPTLHSTYMGERNGFSIHSIDAPKSNATIETFTGDSGVTLLVVSNKVTGRSQAFVLPEGNASRGGTITTQVAGDVELEPLVIRSDGSGVYAVRKEGELIGFMTVSASGVWQFIAVDTNPK
jgi:hypothetical protein